jgi:hypothetical protein
MAYSFPDPVDESFDIGLKSGSVTETYVVPYADIKTITDEVLNPSLPRTHGIYTGLICKGVAAQLLKDWDTNSWKNVSVTLSYENPEEDEDDDLISFSLDVGAEALSLPKDPYTIGSSSEELDDDQPNPQKIIPHVGYKVTAYHQASVDITTIRGLVGKVNNAVFHTFAAETVLYEGASANKTIKTDGTEGWDITHNFAVHTSDWNKVWHTTNAGWEKIDPELYELGDFSALGLC